MATTAAPIARNIRSRLRLSAAELGGLRKRTLIAKVDILPDSPCDPCGFRAGLCPLGFGWMVVSFVRVIRVPACARVSRVSRVCPGSPRCLFTGTVVTV